MSRFFKTTLLAMVLIYWCCSSSSSYAQPQSDAPDTVGSSIENSSKNSAVNASLDAQSPKSTILDTFEIKDMDINDVFKLLSAKSGLNIIAGKNITGRVTIFLQNVEVHDALIIILKANDLAYIEGHGVIQIMTGAEYEQVTGHKFGVNMESSDRFKIGGRAPCVLAFYGEDIADMEAKLGMPANSICAVDFIAHEPNKDGGWANYGGSGWYVAQNYPPERKLTVAVGFFPNGENATMAAAARGDYNSHYADVASNLLDYGHGDAIIRIAWEFQGDWYPWGYNALGQDTTNYIANYIAAFRNVVREFRKVSPKFTFVWNPNLDDGYRMPDLESAYPGDDVVDSIGLDVYDFNWNNLNDPKERFQHDIVDTKFGLSWLKDFAAKHHKPISLPEWGCGGDNGDNPYCIEATANWIKQNNMEFNGYWSGDAQSGFDGNLETRPKQKAQYLKDFYQYNRTLPDVGTTYYVSPSGSDNNNRTSKSTP